MKAVKEWLKRRLEEGNMRKIQVWRKHPKKQGRYTTN